MVVVAVVVVKVPAYISIYTNRRLDKKEESSPALDSDPTGRWASAVSVACSRSDVKPGLSFLRSCVSPRYKEYITQRLSGAGETGDDSAPGTAEERQVAAGAVLAPRILETDAGPWRRA